MRWLGLLAWGAGSGLCLAISGEAWGWPPLAWVFAASLAAVLWRTRNAQQAFAVGLASGTAANAFALDSIVPLLQAFGSFPLYAAVPTAAL